MSSVCTHPCLVLQMFTGGHGRETPAVTKHVTLSVSAALRRPGQGENPGARDPPCVTASPVCSLQGRLRGGLEGLRLPAVPADGGRRLGGGL